MSEEDSLGTVDVQITDLIILVIFFSSNCSRLYYLMNHVQSMQQGDPAWIGYIYAFSIFVGVVGILYFSLCFSLSLSLSLSLSYI